MNNCILIAVLACNRCGTVYTYREGVIEAGANCPREVCGGSIMEINSPLIPAVTELTFKGHHVREAIMKISEGGEIIVLIVFEGYSNQAQKLPVGFEFTGKPNPDTCVEPIQITKIIDRDLTDNARLAAIIETAADLLSWARKLYR
jgi:hypothetical protein